MSAGGVTQPGAMPDPGGPGGPRGPGGPGEPPEPTGKAPAPADTPPAAAEPQPAALAAPAVSAAPGADVLISAQEEYLPDGEYYSDSEYYEEGEYFPQAWERQPVSKLAVAALISGLLALLPLALGFGIAALVVIRRTGRRGGRMALGGIYAAWIWVLIAVAAGGLYKFTHGFQPQVHTHYRPVAAYGLQVGECLNTSQNAAGFTLIACSSPHEVEVYGRFNLGGSAYPGVSAVRQQAAGSCAPLFQAYVNSSLTNIGYDMVYVYPDQQAWTEGERTVICEARFTDGEISGSIRATG